MLTGLPATGAHRRVRLSQSVHSLSRLMVCGLVVFASLISGPAAQAEHSIARLWNEELLEAIRNDFARPTVHGRNLFHTSVAMWDAWAAYDPVARNYLHQEKASAVDVAAARREAISYASYRILRARFVNSPGADESLGRFDARMTDLGYDMAFTDTVGLSGAALGNRIAATVLAFGAGDGANEQDDYANLFYEPFNPPLIPALPGNPDIIDPNRWQPLVLDFFQDQSGNVFPSGVPPFLGPEWGTVTPFALRAEDLTIYEADGHQYWVYLDPGAPPYIGGVGDEAYRSGFEQVVEWSSYLDPTDGVMIDISPNARGNSALGTNDGVGHTINPVTGLPYTPEIVPAGDYYRVLAEFWADGPDSETPPGHWFTIANYVSDHPLVVKRIAAVGPLLDDLEWDVKLYLALAGTVHDAAVAAWGAKGWYDYVRPVSAIRYMADKGQRSDPQADSYDPNGISLKPGFIELITEETIAQGERHYHLRGLQNRNLGKIVVRTWRGPDYISDPKTTSAGVGWILAEEWWPYQRPSFVTPPFAGYVSGHSTFSRAAAEMMTLFTGDAFFPGGLGEFFAPKNEFLVFEDGPSMDITLQWATYRDASDETSISRIYGGIHPTADDIPGRLMGYKIGPAAFLLASQYYGPWPTIHIDRATLKRSGPKTLLAVKGSFETGVFGEGDVFDLAAGLQVHVTDPEGDEVRMDFEPDACQVQEENRFKCSRNGGAETASFEVAAGGTPVVTFNLVAYQYASIGQLSAPLQVRLETGDIRRSGQTAKCRSRSGSIYCQ